MVGRIRVAFALLAAIAAGIAQAGAPTTATRTVSFSDALCGSLLPLPLTFTIPASYDLRAPARNKASGGCFWGAKADLDRVLRNPEELDFTGIGRGVFWARPAMNVGYDLGRKAFFGGDGADEAAMMDQFRGSGFRNVHVQRSSAAGLPTLELTGEVPPSGGGGADRVYMLYLALEIEDSVVLINYHPAKPSSSDDDAAWKSFLAGIQKAAIPGRR